MLVPCSALLEGCGLCLCLWPDGGQSVTENDIVIWQPFALGVLSASLRYLKTGDDCDENRCRLPRSLDTRNHAFKLKQCPDFLLFFG